MLKSIRIDNYALIEKLEIEFQEGLTIITGETGAGKTILLGALGLLLGKRADTSVLKDLERKCVVEGVFLIKDYNLEKFFKLHELDYQDETIIHREIASNGKSRAFINDTPVNLDVLQELTLSLIDIHSQHQNLSLNDESYLRWIIDSYAGTLTLSSSFSDKFSEFLRLQKHYYQARELFYNDRQNLDFITHQFNELKAAGIKVGELPLLDQEFNMLAHAEEIKSGLKTINDLLHSEEAGIVGRLKMVCEQMTKIKTILPDTDEFAQRVQSAYVDIKDFGMEIDHWFEKADFDPQKMEETQKRIDLLNTLLHKYKVTTEAELIENLNLLDKKLQEHSSGDYSLEQLTKELNIKETQMMDAARQLSDERIKAFPQFESKVTSLLKSLGMGNSVFNVKWEEVKPMSGGIDRIRFFFSANKNVAAQDISKIASGGELSRLMLTIKYLFSNTSGLPTIIFDEIDSGVSGDIADKVGNLIKDMAAGMQVINITHLPQVASKGDHHFLVYKSSIDKTTKTFIKKLNPAERLNEIAKMLSGDSISDAAIENARVLLGSK